MLRHGYPRLEVPSGTGSADVSTPLQERSFELAEFLVDILGVRELGSGLEGRTLAYHHGCHALRELEEREAPLALLRSAGARLVDWVAAEECCGFGGLFSVKAAPVSVAMADRKLDTLPVADALVSADPGCLLHLGGRALHRGMDLPIRPLASILWEARGLGHR